jgi:hypothetical protein
LQRVHAENQQYHDTCTKLQEDVANLRNSEVEMIAMADVKIAKLEGEMIRVQDEKENVNAEMQARLDSKDQQIRMMREAHEERIREIKERADMEANVSRVYIHFMLILRLSYSRHDCQHHILKCIMPAQARDRKT